LSNGESQLTEEEKTQLDLMKTIRQEYIDEIETLNRQEEAAAAKVAMVQKEIDEFAATKELNILQTNPHSSYERFIKQKLYPGSLEEIELPTIIPYNSTMRYIPYIKDGCLQVYIDGA
jgi:hypothetical protein